MKNYTTLLFVLFASFLSFQVSATTFTYSNGWDANGTPSDPLSSGDIININSGTFNQSGSLTIVSGVTVTLLNGATWKLNNTDALINNSTSFNLFDKLELKDNSTFVNNGDITIEDGGELSFKGSASFTNSATGNITLINGGKFKFDNSSTFSNAGTLDLFDKLEMKGSSTLTNTGDINIESGGEMKFKDSAVLTNSTSGNIYVKNGGKLKLEDTTSYTNDGFIQVAGKFEQKDSAAGTNNGTLVITVDGTLKVKDTATFSNTGNMVINGKVDLRDSSTFNNSGTIIGTGTFKVKNNATPVIINTGTINGCTTGCIGTTGTTNLSNTSSIPAAAGIEYIYDGGFIPALPGTGTPTCDDNVVFLGAYNITSDFTAGNIVVAASLTIESGNSLTVCNVIVNNGSIALQNNASLVQNGVIDANVNTGNYSIYQASGQQSDSNYNIWSSPVKDADLITTYPATNPCGMYVFNASNQEWAYDFLAGSGTYSCGGNPVDFTSFLYTDGGAPDGLMDAGRGYFIPGDGTTGAKTFTGEINNGTVSVTIYSTSVAANATTWSGDDWNLIGNPYPSSIDPAAFMVTNGANLTDGLYFWDESISDYAVYGATGATTPAGFTVAVGQGFYVLTNDVVIPDGTNTTITFENSMRDISGGTFYKKENTDNHNIGYSISTPSGEINKIIVGYSALSTDGIDKLYDAHKLSGNTNIRFASLLNNEEFIIQGIATPRYGQTKNIPLVVFTTETGNHTFSEFKNENIPTGMNVYLQDNTTNKRYNLAKGDYTVHLDGNQEYNNRFELVFENVSVKSDNAQTDRGTSDNSTDAVTSIENVNIADWSLATSESVFTLSNSNGINGTIQVLDLMGRVVWTTNSNSNTSVKMDLNNVSSGIYFIQVITGTERVYSNKIVNP